MHICLFANLLLKITFCVRKQNKDLLFRIVAVKVRALVTAFYQRMLPSAQNSVTGEQNHSGTASSTAASMWNLQTTKVLLQRADKVDVTWEQVRCVRRTTSELLQQLGCEVTLHSSAPEAASWRSQMCKELSHTVSVCRATNFCAEGSIHC